MDQRLSHRDLTIDTKQSQDYVFQKRTASTASLATNTILGEERHPSSSSSSPVMIRSGRKFCSSPRCASPVLVSSSSLSSPHSRTSSSPASPNCISSPSSTKLITPQRRMNMETYFRLLKKSQVLDQLLHMNTHLTTSEEQVRKLQSEKAKADSVQQHVFTELDNYQRQYIDVQKFFLELLEEMTTLCVKEERLRLGDSTIDAVTFARKVAEERTMQDLQNHATPTSSSPTKQNQISGSNTISMALSVESQALRAVGRKRMQQIEKICCDYELQLVKSEEELTQAIHSSFTKECIAKLAQSEAREKQLSQEKVLDKSFTPVSSGKIINCIVCFLVQAALTERLRALTKQNERLQDQVAQLQDENITLEQENQRLDRELSMQSSSLHQFASDMKAELKKRYGNVPSVLDQWWRHYFPSLPIPS